MNLKVINEKIKTATKNNQPSLSGWLNRLKEPQPIQPPKRKLGACIANSDQNKRLKVDEKVIKFENLVRENNRKFNSTGRKFGPDDQTVKIKSVNVNSVKSVQKMSKIKDLLNDEPDILALTDTRVKEFRFLKFKSKERTIFATKTGARGVAIIIKRSLTPEICDRDEDEGNYISLTFSEAGVKYGLINICGPNDDNEIFWNEKISDQIMKLKDLKAKHIIICGDLNIPLGTQIGYAPTRLKKKEALLTIMDANNLSDAASNQADPNSLNPYSFWRRKQDRTIVSEEEEYQATRIDHFVTSLAGSETSIKYLRYFPSDHSIVELKIKINTRCGKKSWKMNPGVLDNEEAKSRLVKIYKKLTKNLIKRRNQIEMSKMNELDQAKKIREIAFSKWEAVLKVTKKIANSWARNKSDEERKLRKFLIKAKENLEISNDEYELMSEEMREYEVNKNKIKSELMKVKNKIDNKTLLKYKAMKSQTSRTIRELKIGDEVYQSDHDIRKQITAHFTTIFRCDCDYGKNEEICSRCKKDDVSFTKNINPEKFSNKPINEKDRKLLDGEIEEKEVDEYVKKHFKKEGKSPGPDGIPYIYIFKMWTHLKKIISTLVIKSFATCDFEMSLSEGLIVFLHKNGKPPNEIKSWRPLTLLNSIFKIASGILAQRLKKKIPKITHKHQYGFVNGKNASDMVELLKKIIGEEKKEGINTVLLALDFKGAFDTVKHEAIIRALKMKKFGGKFINRVAALLAGNESKIIVNGRMNGDEKVKIRRSARQGDPLSPYLFILVLDELLERMDDDYLLKGIQIGSEKITSLAFADDNYTAITDTTEGIKLKVNKIKQTMEKFRKKTGLTINVAKSEILCNDRTLADRLKSLEEIDLKTTIVSLGIPIGVDASIENEITSRLEMGLNMVEKIEVINVLIIPKVIHLMRHLKYNKKKCDEWSKLMKDFIWCNKKCTVKREILEDSWDNGCWGLSSLSVTWMK